LTKLPDDFAVSERVQIWAEQKGYTQLDEHLESFRLKCEAMEYRYRNWDSAFMEAIRADWAGLRRNGTRPSQLEHNTNRATRRWQIGDQTYFLPLASPANDKHYMRIARQLGVSLSSLKREDAEAKLMRVLDERARE